MTKEMAEAGTLSRTGQFGACAVAFGAHRQTVI
jgi:hypothetical protein